MEILAVIFGLLFIASPIVAFIALVKVNELRSDLDYFKSVVHELVRAETQRSVQVETRPQPKTSVTKKSDAPKRAPPSKPVKAAALQNPAKTAQDAPLKAPSQKAPIKPARPPKEAPKPKVTLEEMIGSQWSVWVGGIALLIGAVLLLRFSIEAGVFTPAMRIGMAALMGGLALGGGEWLRRNDLSEEIAKKASAVFQQHAYIPGILTAVGIFTWLGTIYTAHTLYGFFGSSLTFALLGLTSLLGLALGLLHGPKLAALGLLAAFATPSLVGASEPNYMVLYVYLLFITGAALAVSYRRQWPLIAVLGLLGAFILPVLADISKPNSLFVFGYLLLITAAALALAYQRNWLKVAALGLVGAFVAPVFMGIFESYIALYSYLLITSCGVIAVAHRRGWPEIIAMVMLGLLVWSFLTIEALEGGFSIGLWVGFAAISYAVGTWVAQISEQEPVVSRTSQSEPEPTRKKLSGKQSKKQVEADAEPTVVDGMPDMLVRFNQHTFMLWTLILGVITMLPFVFNPSVGAPTVVAALSVAALFILNGARDHSFKYHIIIGGVLATLALLMGKLGLGLTVMLMAIVTLSMWVLCFRQSRHPMLDNKTDEVEVNQWSLFSVTMPLVAWGVFSLLRGGIRSSEFGWFKLSEIGRFEGGIYLAIAAIFAASVEYLWRKKDANVLPINIYAVGSGAAIFASILLCLKIDMMFYAYLLSSVVGLGIYVIRPLLSLRLMMSGAVALSILMAVFYHIPMGGVGMRFVFNSLWIFLAAPAVICFVAARIFERETSDIWSEGLKALGLSAAALFTVLQIHHLMNSGQVLAFSFSLEEAALLVLTGLCFTFGGSWMDRGVTTQLNKRPVHKQFLPILSIGLSLLTVGVFVFSVCFDMNPLFSSGHAVKGNILLNSLVLAYLLPSLLLAAIAVWTRGSRPEAYVRLIGALGFVSFMIYLTAMVRFLFGKTNMNIFTHLPVGIELYAISAVWLIVGIAWLVIGIRRENRDIRLVSGVIIILAVLKAFLIDMANLEGVLRAMSFVILGLVLIVIGRVYQKLIFADKPLGKRPAKAE